MVGPMMKPRLAWLALAGAAMAAPHAGWAADSGAWSDARTSPAISRLETEVAVMYSAAQAGIAVPPGARITQVHASRAREGGAVVRTSLCWNGMERCVPLSGAHVNTRAFEGLDAAGRYIWYMP